MKTNMMLVLDLHESHWLVVGGGQVAERKIRKIIQSGARVDVVSPFITSQIEEWFKDQKINWIPRNYRREDGEGKQWIIAATNDEHMNELICKHAKERGQWVNVVDAAEQSSFTFPAMTSRGKLQIAVSTSGTSPFVAREISRSLSVQFGEEYEIYLDFLAELRLKVKQLVDDTNKRQKIFAFVANSDLLTEIKSGDFQSVKKRWLAKIEHMAEGL